MPPRTAIPKARHPSTVTLEVRIVESHYLTTATCRTNANKATLRSKLCQAACDTLQYTYHASIYESKDASRCVACIRVQETGFGPGHWKRIGWTGTLEYRDWFDRNVLFGSEDTLRIELHFSTDASASAKPSSAVLTTREYLMLGDQATIGDKWMDEQKMWEPSTAYFFAGARVTLCGQRASLDTQYDNLTGDDQGMTGTEEGDGSDAVNELDALAKQTADFHMNGSDGKTALEWKGLGA